MKRSVVVVGGGLSGVTAARALAADGHPVRLLEAGPSLGGRLATRTVEDVAVEVGTPSFQVRAPSLGAWVESRVAGGDLRATTVRAHRWQQGRLVAPSLTSLERRYVAPAGLGAMVEGLASALDVRTRAPVRALSASSGRWRLTLASGESQEADALVLAMPAPTALSLARTAAEAIDVPVLAELARVAFDPCLVVVASYDRPLPAWRHVSSNEGVVASLTAQAGERTVITVEARAAWSSSAFAAADDTVASSMLEAAASMAGGWLRSPHSTLVARWQHARPTMLATARAPVSQLLGPPVVFCGDWCISPGVEGAFLSGTAAAECLAFLP